MALKPYKKPYCEIFYHGSVSRTGDPAPLVPPTMRGPGITEVTAAYPNIFLHWVSSCATSPHQEGTLRPSTVQTLFTTLMSAGQLCNADELYIGYAALPQYGV